VINNLLSQALGKGMQRLDVLVVRHAAVFIGSFRRFVPAQLCRSMGLPEGCHPRLLTPGNPTGNSLIESFNGKFGA